MTTGFNYGDPSIKKEHLPTEYTQCAIFYGVPIANELENFSNPKKVKPSELREELEKQKFVFPFYSQQIFMNPKDAELFLPGFVRQLISEGKLPEDIVDSKGLLDSDRAQACTVPLKVSFVERVDD